MLKSFSVAVLQSASVESFSVSCMRYVLKLSKIFVTTTTDINVPDFPIPAGATLG